MLVYQEVVSFIFHGFITLRSISSVEASWNPGFPKEQHLEMPPMSLWPQVDGPTIRRREEISSRFFCFFFGGGMGGKGVGVVQGGGGWKREK